MDGTVGSGALTALRCVVNYPLRLRPGRAGAARNLQVTGR